MSTHVIRRSFTNKITRNSLKHINDKGKAGHQFVSFDQRSFTRSHMLLFFSRGQSLDVTELWFHRHWNEPHRFHMKRSPLAPLLFSHITAIHRLQRNWHHREFTIVTYLSHSRSCNWSQRRSRRRKMSKRRYSRPAMARSHIRKNL